MHASTPPASTWLATAAEPAVVRRALGTALVVGAMLIAINHGDAIAAGAVDGARALKMALTVLEPDAIPAIRAPSFVTGRTADAQMKPDEPIIGVVVDGEAHAYSTWHLDAHEIVNDQIAGTAIAASW